MGNQKFAEKPVWWIPAFTKVVLNTILLSLFFFVLIQKRIKKNPGYFHFLTLK